MKLDLSRILKGVVLSLVFLVILVSAVLGVNEFIFNKTLQNVEPNFLPAGISAVAINENTEKQDEGLVQQDAQLAISQLLEAQLDPSKIYAKSAIAVGANLKDNKIILYEKNINEKLPIASLTKLMTAVVVLENYDLLENITVSKKADSQDAVKTDLKEGDSFSVIDLIYIMLIRSSNKAAFALAEQKGEQNFIDLMNQKSAEIGLVSTVFKDPTGLSEENVSTANDFAKFAEYVLKKYPQIFDITKTKEFVLPNLGRITNTDELLGEIPEIVGGKTGYTLEAKGCLLLITKNSHAQGYLIYVILGSDDRFLEMRKLINLELGE